MNKTMERALLLFTAINMLAVISIMALWAVDISVSALVLGQTTKQMFFLTNGFWETNPTQLYHAGLWLLTICIILLSVICMYLTIVVFRNKVEEKHEDNN